jgi:hypothetical protein
MIPDKHFKTASKCLKKKAKKLQKNHVTILRISTLIRLKIELESYDNTKIHS